MKFDSFKRGPSLPGIWRCDNCGEEVSPMSLDRVCGEESDGSDDELWCNRCMEKALGNSQKVEPHE